MFATLADEEVTAERSDVGVKPHVIAQAPDFPLLSLSNRQFELLVHALLEVEASEAAGYDRASILAEGADRGRDILLFRNGIVVGLAQCKRYAQRLGIGQILTELLKFGFFAVRDSRLVPSSSWPFTYQLWTASGLTDEAREFFDTPRVARQTLTDRAAAYADRARGSIVTLSKPEDEVAATAELNEAVRIILSFALKHVGPSEIGPSLLRNSKVRRWFFRSPEDGPPRAGVTEIDSLVRDLRRERLSEFGASPITGARPYVPRDGLEKAFDDFLASEARLFVLVGESGQGKSSWAARLLEYPPRGYSADIIKAEEISAAEDLATQTIARSLQARRMDGVPTYDFVQAVWEWVDADNRILIVDGVDRAREAVRETLAGWLRRTVALTQRTSLRVVISSRRQAWSVLSPQLSDLNCTIFGSEATHRRKSVSFELVKLDPEEAEAVYSAYGVSAEAHRGKQLPTPALIARFAMLSSEAPESIVTRADVMSADLTELKNELRIKPGVGLLGSERLFDQLAQALLRSTDGQVLLAELALGSAGDAALEALLVGDRASIRDGRIRLESDDTIELLMGSKLDVDAAVTSLAARRGDSLFIGAIAMMVARMEKADPDAVSTALDRLLENAPQGHSPQLDAISRAILELRAPERAHRHIAAAVALWNQPNFMLLLSNLANLLDEVALPALERFRLMRPLISGEDTDDWRDKYWLYPQPGRIVTPFARAASRAAADDPEALLPILLGMIANSVDKELSVATGLLREAAALAPQLALAMSWSMLQDGYPRAFGIVASSVPAATSAFLTSVPLDTPESRREVVERLWQIAHSTRVGEGLSSEVRQAVMAAADHLRSRITEPGLKTRTIILRLLQRGDVGLERELVDLWPTVSDDDFWFAMKAVGNERVRLLADLLEGRSAGRPAGDLVARLDESVFPDFQIDAVVRLLRIFAESGAESARDVSRAVELMLYTMEGSEDHPELWELANYLAGSSDDETRHPLIYYAGSKCGHKAHSLELRRRNCLVEILVDSENGPNVDNLVWKIIDSAGERPNPVQHLLRLSQRVGKEKVLLSIQRWASILPLSESFCRDAERALAGADAGAKTRGC
jgi:hypothetical protein